MTAKRTGTKKSLVLPARGYVATPMRVHRKEWEESINWNGTDSLSWTTVTGGIRCWPHFNYDRDNVNDPNSTVDVLAMWGSRSYFDASGRAWMFTGSLEVPPRTAADCDILQMAREAFNAADFLAVHCNIEEFMSADDASGVRIGVRVFLQASKSRSHKWESWLPHPWEWRPLRGGLGGSEEFESASSEVNTANSGWVELLVDGTLGKNNAVRTADALKARAARSSARSSGLRSGIESAHSLEFPSFRKARGACISSTPRTHSNYRLFDRPAPQARRRPRQQNLPRPRKSAREGATAASSAAEKDRARNPLPLLHRRRDAGGIGQKW